MNKPRLWRGLTFKAKFSKILLGSFKDAKMAPKRRLFTHSVPGKNTAVSRCLVISDFYRNGWVLGLVYDEHGDNRKHRDVKPREFVDEFLRVLNSSRSPQAAFRSAYQKFIKDVPGIFDFTLFLAEKDGIWTTRTGMARVYKISSGDYENLTKRKEMSVPSDDESGLVPKLCWDILTEDDCGLLMVSGGVMLSLAETEIIKVAVTAARVNVVDELVAAAERKDPAFSYSASLVTLK